MALRIAGRPETDVTLFDLFRPRDHLRDNSGWRPVQRLSIALYRSEGLLDQVPDFRMLDVAGRRNDDVGADVGAAEVLADCIPG